MNPDVLWWCVCVAMGCYLGWCIGGLIGAHRRLVKLRAELRAEEEARERRVAAALRVRETLREVLDAAREVEGKDDLPVVPRRQRRGAWRRSWRRWRR